MNTKPFYILSDNSLTIFHKGQLNTVASDVQNWHDIKAALATERYDELVELIDQALAFKNYVSPVSSISVDETSIIWNGKPMAGVLIDRILSMKAEGFCIDPMILFLENLQDNPSYRSREQLYGFLEYNNIPITTDGCFMAYKRIRDDWSDVYTGMIDNSIGSFPSMQRSEVDDDPTRTCSAGFHVAGLDYLKNYSGGRLIGVKVNPANVVSVPTDYHHTKMRVAAYEVIEELPMDLIGGSEDHWGDAPVVSNGGRESMRYVMFSMDNEPLLRRNSQDADVYVIEHDFDDLFWDVVGEEWVDMDSDDPSICVVFEDEDIASEYLEAYGLDGFTCPLE